MHDRMFRSVRQRRKSILKSVFDRPAGFHCVHISHQALWSAVSLKHRMTRRVRQGRNGVVIVCPPGGGNIGDQALVESAAWNSGSPVTLIVRHDGDYEIPLWLAIRQVSTVALPKLLYGNDLAHLRDVSRFIAIAQNAKSATFIGADIMDGCYNPRASINRWSLALLAHACGAKASILGFSWNTAPTGSARAGLLKARNTVALWVRDPASLRRARAAGATKARLCSDVVFSHPGRDLPEKIRSLPEFLDGKIGPPGSYAIVNASGYIGNDAHVIEEYKAIVSLLLSAGLTVVLLPHVARRAADLDCLKLLHQPRPCESVLIECLLSPVQVAELATGAQIVVTGRMHLAVLSSLVGTPVLTLASQGKVEGLYELLERPEWALDRNSNFSEPVGDALEEIQSADVVFPSPNARKTIERLSRAQFLSRAL